MALAARASHRTVVVGWLGRATMVLIDAAVFTDLPFHRGGDLGAHLVSRRAAHVPWVSLMPDANRPQPLLLFLSHAGIDTEGARALKQRLEAAPEAREYGLRVWFDKDDLRAMGVPLDIADVPAGTYHVKAWHPRLGVAEQTVTISAGQPASLALKLGSAPAVPPGTPVDSPAGVR